ncbi:Na(+)/H(+) antiporter NhaA-like [Convolutriloba macropyga]|uniref:Na(+)/H(+) antiporter NhaA-like n=1 Tax=Convolutriloba macropyga TaxID=536237 RepID=UPI003F526D27
MAAPTAAFNGVGTAQRRNLSVARTPRSHGVIRVKSQQPSTGYSRAGQPRVSSEQRTPSACPTLASSLRRCRSTACRPSSLLRPRHRTVRCHSIAAPVPEPSGIVVLEAPTNNTLSPLHKALEEGLGSIVLLAATALSIILANTGMGPSWIGLWDTPIGPPLGGHQLTLQAWVNEGLMALFFFAVGLEIKRECVFGHLASIKQSILPCAAALGGMVVPICMYVALNAGSGGAMSGWAIPMATDIAFAMGIFGFFNRRMPRSSSAFLLTLATVDDLGAILVIALFFATKINAPFLAAAAAVSVSLFAIERLPWKQLHLAMYGAAGVALWYCLLVGGVNADVAGVITALAIPAASKAPHTSKAVPLEHGHSPTLMDHLIYKMVPWTALLIMPLFALANTAVQIDLSMLGGLMSQPVSVGILAGLLLGKPLGITAFSVLAVKSGIAKMPKSMTTKHLVVLGLLGGIGFTMCLFLIALAMAHSPDAMNAAKLAVISASGIAAVVAMAVMRSFPLRKLSPAEEGVIHNDTPPSAFGTPEYLESFEDFAANGTAAPVTGHSPTAPANPPNSRPSQARIDPPTAH